MSKTRLTIGLDQLWSPDDSVPYINLWLDANDYSTIIESSGSVSGWNDKKGNGINLLQGVGANKPTTNSRTHNSLNVLDFDGTQYLENASFPVPSSGDIAIYMVGGIDAIDDIFDSIFSMNAISHDFQFASSNASQFDGQIQSDSIGANVDLTGSPFMGVSIYNTNFDFRGLGVCNAYIDGTQRAVDTAYTSRIGVTQSLKLFANRSSTARPDGFVGEFLIVEDVTLATRQKIEGYLAHKWGLADKLPIAHPYKILPPLQ